MTLLSMSLNAQVNTQTKAKPLSKTQVATFNFNKMLRGIKGMESILSVSGQANGQFRAPLRYDADLFNTLGPFSGDNFDYGIGFPEAYPEGPQDILVTTVLNRSEYESHIGEQIVGFRFALWGDATKTVKVSDFITYPMNSNSGFDQNHLYEWTLADLEGNEPPSGDEPGGETVTKYVKVTSSDDLTSGEYLIVCEAQNVIFDGSVSGSTLNGANSTAAPTISNNAIEYTADLDAKDFTIDMSNGTVKSASGYYIGCENTNNAVSYNQNTQYTNTITVNSGTASIIYRYNNADRPLKCNTQNSAFRYYKTTSGNVADIQLYKKVAVPSSKAPRRADRAGEYVLLNDAIDGSKYSTGVDIDNNLSAPWSATYLRNQTGNILYIRSGGSMVFTVPSGYNNANFKFVFKTSNSYYNGYFTFTPSNGAAQQVNTSAASTEYEYECQGLSSGNTVTITGKYSSYEYSPDFMYMYVYVQDSGDSNEGYVELEPGQWHEFYLDQPVEFQVENDDDQLFMGYWYKQYPLSSQNDEVMNPAAVNSQSTGHSHYVNMVAGSAGAGDLVISLPYSMNIRTITVYDTNGNTLTTWDANTAFSNSDYTQVTVGSNTRYAFNLPTGWSISDGNYLLYWGNSTDGRFGYLLGDDDLTIASSALNGNTTVRVVMNVYDDNGSGTISVNGQSQTISGSSLANYTWNNVDLSATVYERSWFNPDFSEVGDLAVQLIFKTTKPTPEAPTVTPTTGDSNVTITISPDEATDGELVYTYYDQNGNEIQNATNPMTFERGATDYVITVHAYTTETENYNQSPEAVEYVTIPAIGTTSDWMLMEGTYTNGSDQLSFTRRNANNDVEPILFVDQFTDLTRHNDHPDHYNYHLSEVVETNARTSSTVPVPVYKTYSKLDGLFTKDEVDNDDYADVENRLPGNAVNGKMSYDIKTDADMYYYGLFRGGLTEEHPVINENHRFSMLQQSDEQDTYFFSEAYSNNVLPKYQHIGSSDVERIDKEYIIGDLGGNEQAQMNTNTITYVPVIWTWGQNTGRIDGINNSYGSDIKVSELGNLSITIGGARTNEEPTGRWNYGGEAYCVYAPVINIEGFLPQIVTAEDGDTYVYEPYMYRAWCTYGRARNFEHNTGTGGHKELIDAGERKAPFLIGEVKVADLAPNTNHLEAVIGSVLTHGSAQTLSSFGVPVSEGPENVEFIVRFYYKKTVTDAAPSTSGMRGNRDGGSEGYGMAERGGNGGGIPTGISELTNIAYVVSKTYVNAQGMQSDKPFDGLNIVVTRFSDGTTTTTKVVR